MTSRSILGPLSALYFCLAAAATALAVVYDVPASGQDEVVAALPLAGSALSPPLVPLLALAAGAVLARRRAGAGTLGTALVGCVAILFLVGVSATLLAELDASRAAGFAPSIVLGFGAASIGLSFALAALAAVEVAARLRRPQAPGWTRPDS